MDNCAVCRKPIKNLSRYPFYTAKTDTLSQYEIGETTHSREMYSNFLKHDYLICGLCQLKWETLPRLIWGIPIISGIIGIILYATKIDTGFGLGGFTLLLLLPLAWLLDKKLNEYKLGSRLRDMALSADGSGRKVFSKSEYDALK